MGHSLELQRSAVTSYSNLKVGIEFKGQEGRELITDQYALNTHIKLVFLFIEKHRYRLSGNGMHLN